MNYLFKYGSVLLLLALTIVACRKEPSYSDVPHIEFDRVEQYTYTKNRITFDSLVLVVDFQDGDGNLGLARVASGESDPDFLPPFDQSSPYFNNFFVNLQVKRDGQYVPYPLGQYLNLNGRFPRLSSDEKNEALEGEIKYTLTNFSDDIFDSNDTVRFEIFIYDRAQNKSNVVYTDDVVLFQGQ
ncbi:hypothetical protein CLV24_12460 [Pontibacter ummariensis]|uniref:Uncharacterized protein n=1 Tax=Pontibacter ummariensis TaxID=1610492 RepID=A0A239JUR0_9BACT|nr:hypothetical protein [Pontibacter ummariensis]PRY07322.1 hypothetical protein CLV24_12460 [Pontibacter ummariensis]SNT09676.1 hypothetical protein SAMN06296052_1244 [Pontibacter ummariensis]